MTGMVCTRCFKQTSIDFDTSGLDFEVIRKVCENWKCSSCLDEIDEEQKFACEAILTREPNDV